MKHDVNSHWEELLWFPHSHIESVMSSNGHRLLSDQEIYDAFLVHFHDCFARLPDLLVEEFSSYLVDIPCFQAAEAASCERKVTECKICDMLKQVSPNKSSGLDGLKCI